MSKKKNEEKRKKQESRRLLYIGICAIVFILVIGFFFFAWSTQLPDKNAKLWTIDATGKLSFTDTGDITASSNITKSTANYTFETVTYKSFGDDVYASLVIPKNVTKPPVVIVLPAMTITKEANMPTALALCDMGYATLTLDERGNGGQTQGDAQNDWNSGYEAFMAGGDPVQYKQIYDVLKGYDYIKTRFDLDSSNVSLLGESIGGMWAIVAAGEQPAFKGVITISSSDFAFTATSDQNATKFIGAVMPSKYLSSLPPRKLAMFQFDNDSIVPIADGKALYDKASEPKAWHQYNGTTHGLWDPAFADDVHQELKAMLGR
ncbi:MAG TPA: acetylxylan esterase [Methanocella sp.]|uniref:alpha/beta hydrolase n=1 Tax=Methanocella sp. TaxID=2052833 RepID=UPI002CD22243|nr:acetylxylan esterase [Methanocella sp.]HTY90154.1 acetylxylan esterase [Methanocella sp.]